MVSLTNTFIIIVLLHTSLLMLFGNTLVTALDAVKLWTELSKAICPE